MTEARSAEKIEKARPGRKRDHSRDAVILDAALDVLADTGWDGLTMDLVAQRARAGKATLYRRWPSKTDLLLDAVTRLTVTDPADGDVELPDTGTLLGDILALLQPQQRSERHVKVMAALTSLMLQNVDLAEEIDTALHGPWVKANRTAMQRAIDRGEFPAHADVETLSRVLPSMAAYRILLQHRDLDVAYLTTLVETVLIPALRAAPAGP